MPQLPPSDASEDSWSVNGWVQWSPAGSIAESSLPQALRSQKSDSEWSDYDRSWRESSWSKRYNTSKDDSSIRWYNSSWNSSWRNWEDHDTPSVRSDISNGYHSSGSYAPLGERGEFVGREGRRGQKLPSRSMPKPQRRDDDPLNASEAGSMAGSITHAATHPAMTLEEYEEQKAKQDEALKVFEQESWRGFSLKDFEIESLDSLGSDPAEVMAIQRRPFTRGFFISLKSIGFSCTALLSHYINLRENCGTGGDARALAWRDEVYEDETKFVSHRAHCSFKLAGHNWYHVGPWMPDDRAAQTQCSAMILELFQVDPGIYGGKTGRAVMCSSEEYPEDLRTLTCVVDVRNRLLKRFRRQIAASGPTMRMLEWDFMVSPDSEVNFKAICKVPLLAENGASCSRFEGDWALGKKSAQRSACLSLQVYLDQLDHRENSFGHPVGFAPPRADVSKQRRGPTPGGPGVDPVQIIYSK